MNPAWFLASPFSVFIGTVVFGESVILAALSAASLSDRSLVPVVVTAFLGTLVADAGWFLAAKRSVTAWQSSPRRAQALERARDRFMRVGRGRPEAGLLVAKFFYGTRIASIALVASSGLALARFLVFDAMGTVLWLLVLIPIGMGIGFGLDSLGVSHRTLLIVVGGFMGAGLSVRGWKWARTRWA